ncbi:MAG: HAMP domain-containing protein, partial [Moraxellaceae bacterium]
PELFTRVLNSGKNLILGEASEAEYTAQFDALKSAIDTSTATDTNKQKVLGLLDRYNAALFGVVKDSLPKEQINAHLLSSASDFTAVLQNYRQVIETSVNRRISAAEGELNIARTMFAVVLFLTAVGTTLGLFLIYRSIVLPLWHMQAIITQQNRGNDKARVSIQANDELGNLGRAFNRLLDERIKTLSEQSQENETLNTSIIGLIRALGTIAKKDLSIKVPVSADVTGTISDAVNLLTSETARTLHQVKNFSEQINQISDQLQEQSDVVISVAEEERIQVADTVSALDQSAKAMGDIAKEARTANSIASAAIDYTQKAQQSVTQTVDSIQVIRSTISETEKRIKRLGDRSQEITSIVNLINTIAERTHILALNASMHAASAGEAGKGFAVVAEEVQRLAENARGATSEISAMVNNIRVETSDTVNIMNKLITQVADGTKLAEDSGQRMHETEAATRQLVNHVKSIAVNSMNQANAANRVRDGALLITQSTEKTHGKLEEQREQTDELKACARSLVERVSVFKLPEFRSDSRQTLVQPTPNQIHLEKIALSQAPLDAGIEKQPAKIA